MQVIINIETLKPTAEKLVARLTELGVVSKTGKPLVVDQGYEAIAALCGYRNQHALRSELLKLEPYSELLSPMEEAVQNLVTHWAEGDVWGEHPYYTRRNWQHEVDNRDTGLGYWEWVVHQIDANGGEDEHCSCGAPLNDGEGYDGLCGDCADKASCSECGEALPAGHSSSICPDCQAQMAETSAIDRRTRTDYSFSIGSLNHDQLMTECSDQGISYMDCIGEPSEELRAMLLEKYDEAVSMAAEEAQNSYFDTAETCIAAVSGWTRTEADHSMVLTRAVFVENPALPDADTQKVMFTVELVNCQAINSSIHK